MRRKPSVTSSADLEGIAGRTSIGATRPFGLLTKEQGFPSELRTSGLFSEIGQRHGRC